MRLQSRGSLYRTQIYVDVYYSDDYLNSFGLATLY